MSMSDSASSPSADRGKPWFGRCARRLKSCRCGYRFPGGDRRWTCPQCGKDRHCLRSPADGIANSPCNLHGGKSPRGMASPKFKHGKYSKDLPVRLAARMESAEKDPELLALRAEIALYEARCAELMRRLDTGESGSAWGALLDAVTAFEAASRDKDAAAMQSALTAIVATVRRGYADEHAWSDLEQAIERKSILAMRESRRIVEMRAFVTLEQANMIFAALAAAIRLHVRDPVAMSAISREFAKLLGREPPPPVVVDVPVSPPINTNVSESQ